MADDTMTPRADEVEALRRENRRLRTTEAQRDLAEAALRESERCYRDLVEHASDIMYRADRNGLFTYFNPAAVQLLGYTPEEIQGRLYLDLIHPDYRRTAQKFYVRQGRRRIPDTYYEYPAVAKDGTVVWLGQNVHLVTENDEIVGVLAVARDLTERKRAEVRLQEAYAELERRVEERTAELRAINESLQREIAERKRLEAELLQVQKLESVGRLAGGVAHDFNNLLTAILGYAELTQQELLPEDPVIGHIRQIRQAAERAANLTSQLLAFARQQMVTPRILDLNRIVLNVDNMLRRIIGENIHLVIRTDASLGRVRADPGQIEQVLVNLAVNARDAMSQGGTLCIETANVALDTEFAKKHVAMTPGEYVMIAVADTGPAIDEETQHHIFEPFYTTKGSSKGTGMGLATCYGIVKQSDGHIVLDSQSGSGTVFQIYLPRVQEEAVKAVVHMADGPPSGGTETLLLAEDEPQVRDLAARGLRALGYTVLEASDGVEALRIALEYPAEITLLVTDVVMPLMGGEELAHRLQAMRPGTRVLFTSGYTDHAEIREEVADATVELLPKPYTHHALARKVREMLDAWERW